MWNTINYEVCGRKHLKNGTPCQDKTISFSNNEISVIALADGAGSATHSQYGAEVAVKAITDYLSNSFTDIYNCEKAIDVKENIIGEVQRRLKEEEKKHLCTLGNLASTLLAVAIKDDNYIIVHLGDGVIGYVKEGVLRVASKPENGEFSNTTVFTTSYNVINSIRVYKGKTYGITSFVIMSDGTSISFYNKSKVQLVNEMQEIIDYISESEKYEAKETLAEIFSDVVSQRTSDDCSIAILYSVSINEVYKSRFQRDCEFFEIQQTPKSVSLRKIKKYKRILGVLKYKPMGLLELSKKVYVDKKYLSNDLDRLIELEYIEVNSGKYNLVN